MGKLNKWFKNITPTDWVAISILIIAISGMFVLPYWVTQKSWKYDLGVDDSNEIGDTLGGILGPFIGLISAFLVYLALREQIKANTLIQRQFEIEKLEKVEQAVLDGSLRNLSEIHEKLTKFKLKNDIGDELEGEKATYWALTYVLFNNGEKPNKDLALAFFDIIGDLYVVILNFNQKKVTQNHLIMHFDNALIRVLKLTQLRTFEMIEEEKMRINEDFHEVKQYYFFFKELAIFKQSLIEKELY